MTRKELDELWASPNNWSLVYRCVKDPRTIVPRRRPWMGWTINFGHPFAWAVLMVMVAIAVGPGLLLLGLGFVSAPLFLLTLILSIGTVMGLSHWEASRSRE